MRKSKKVNFIISFEMKLKQSQNKKGRKFVSAACGANNWDVEKEDV